MGYIRVVGGVVVTEAVFCRLQNPAWFVTNYCQECGGKFQSVSKTAKFCSDACRQKAYRKRSKKDDLHQAVIVTVRIS